MTTTETRTIDRSMHTPRRSFRCREELWQQAQQHAAEKGMTITEVLTDALKAFVRSG
jgi:hypothetical protein